MTTVAGAWRRRVQRRWRKRAKSEEICGALCKRYDAVGGDPWRLGLGAARTTTSWGGRAPVYRPVAHRRRGSSADRCSPKKFVASYEKCVYCSAAVPCPVITSEGFLVS